MKLVDEFLKNSFYHMLLISMKRLQSVKCYWLGRKQRKLYRSMRLFSNNSKQLKCSKCTQIKFKVPQIGLPVILGGGGGTLLRKLEKLQFMCNPSCPTSSFPVCKEEKNKRRWVMYVSKQTLKRLIYNGQKIKSEIYWRAYHFPPWDIGNYTPLTAKHILEK